MTGSCGSDDVGRGWADASCIGALGGAAKAPQAVNHRGNEGQSGAATPRRSQHPGNEQRAGKETRAASAAGADVSRPQ